MVDVSALKPLLAIPSDWLILSAVFIVFLLCVGFFFLLSWRRQTRRLKEQHLALSESEYARKALPFAVTELRFALRVLKKHSEALKLLIQSILFLMGFLFSGTLIAIMLVTESIEQWIGLAGSFLLCMFLFCGFLLRENYRSLKQYMRSLRD